LANSAERKVAQRIDAFGRLERNPGQQGVEQLLLVGA